MSGRDYRHLRTWSPDVLERALRASGPGPHVGNRIPGTQVLVAHLRERGSPDSFALSDCFDVMTDLQGLAIQLCPGTGTRWARHAAHWIMYRINLGQLAYESHRGTGPCPCLWHRIWRMWLEDYGDALSEW